MTNEEKMRAEFCKWLETEHDVKPIAGIDIDALANMANPQLFAGFQAAYQLQQNKIDELMQNTESMNQTNAALIKKLDITIEALEYYANEQIFTVIDLTGAAQQALSQLKD